MVKLLLTPGRPGRERADRIMAESTRYNLGRVTRTINIPTLAVLLPQPGLRGRFDMTHEGETAIAATCPCAARSGSIPPPASS